jgi:hypothetical protein
MKENQRDEQSPQVRELRLIKGGLWGLTPKTAPAAGHRIPKLRDLGVKPRAGANTKGGGGPNLMLTPTITS